MSGTALAQPDTSLDPLQVVAESLNSSDSVVEEGTLERYQADDLGDIFDQDPQVNVGGALGIAQKLYLRGIEDPLLNVTIDGASQSGSLFHHTGRIGVDPALLKRVEVSAGAGRATDGPGALGGSVRFVTKDPDDLLRDGERFGGLISAGTGTNPEGHRVSTTLFGRFNDQWSAMGTLVDRDHQRFEDGDGNKQAGTDAQQQLGQFKLLGDFAAQRFTLSHEIRQDEGERTQRPQWVVSGFNPLYALDGERQTSTLNYQLRPEGQAWLDLEASLYHTTADVEQNVADRWGRYLGESESTGASVANTSRVGRHQVTYGVDYRDDDVTAGYADNPEQEHESGEVAGVFVQDDITLTDRLRLSAGARYDRYRLTDNSGLSYREDDISPNLGVEWDITDNVMVNASHARAFRGPKAHDAFKLEGASNAMDLRGEQARNSEVGVQFTQGPWELNAEVYRSTIDDVISDPLGGPIRYENVGDLASDGFILSANYQWQALSAGLSFHRNDVDLNGQPLTVYEYNGLGNTMGDTWTANVDYQVNPHWQVGWRSQFVEGIDDLETSVGTIDKPGYGVHDAYVRWLPTRDEDLAITLTANNLFDKQYLDHASNADYQHIPGYEGIVGLAEPGRDIRLGVSLRF
ncbi:MULTISPECIES: TonB-dependent receptor domain-containing protein [unclassified Halomonas]|uniref:TonB-dependent receptor domain-containing protein n=1 Tax=unclassified Halomonas TaxID=2609666 RepID=UPI0018D4012D|nr:MULTISPECIES: TonB-dependent receptor [unclassified Halomonas]